MLFMMKIFQLHPPELHQSNCFKWKCELFPPNLNFDITTLIKLWEIRCLLKQQHLEYGNRD
jgi:hypothetical protein